MSTLSGPEALLQGNRALREQRYTDAAALYRTALEALPALERAVRPSLERALGALSCAADAVIEPVVDERAAFAAGSSSLLAPSEGPGVLGAQWGAACSQSPAIAVPNQGALRQGHLVASSLQCCSSSQGVSIIVLTLDGAQLLQRLLASFLSLNSHQPVEFLIIDHASAGGPEDGTAAVIAAAIERQGRPDFIRHLRRGRNYRFADSCNLGAQHSRYPHLLFLNNDINYTADVLPQALRRLDDPDVGVVGIRLDDDPDALPPGKEPRVQHLGIEFRWSEKRGYFRPYQMRHPNVRQWEQGRPAVDKQGALVVDSGWRPAVMGAFLLCRKADFLAIGGFDAIFDYGLEDIDFCLRMHTELALKTWCETTLRLHHAEMSTRSRDMCATNHRIDMNHERFKARWGARLGDAKTGFEKYV